MVAEIENPYFVKMAKESPRINAMEAIIARCEQVEFEVKHVFTPGLYARTIFMPAGSVLTSKIHKTEHPFVVSKGCAKVFSETSGVIEVRAPYMGITKPGTRRVLEIVEDCIWTTFHPTLETDLSKIESDLIEPHEIGMMNGTIMEGGSS